MLTLSTGFKKFPKMRAEGFCEPADLIPCSLDFYFLLDQNNSLLFFIRELGSKSSRSKCFLRDNMPKKVISRRNSLFFPCLTGNYGQRMVSSGLGHPPTSLRFEAFSGDDRKKRACSGDAPAPPAPERAHMWSHAASLRFSLCGRVIRCRCLLLANARFGQEQPISRAMRRASRASDGRKALA
jgi:hypothetical protein